jgi:hypothetical protein
VTATIEIPRERAGAIMQALEAQADAKYREARSRGNSGQHLAEHRAHLRVQAGRLREDAWAIGKQLRGERVTA